MLVGMLSVGGVQWWPCKIGCSQTSPRASGVPSLKLSNHTKQLCFSLITWVLLRAQHSWAMTSVWIFILYRSCLIKASSLREWHTGVSKSPTSSIKAKPHLLSIGLVHEGWKLYKSNSPLICRYLSFFSDLRADEVMPLLWMKWNHKNTIKKGTNNRVFFLGGGTTHIFRQSLSLRTDGWKNFQWISLPKEGFCLLGCVAANLEKDVCVACGWPYKQSSARRLKISVVL